MDVIKVPPPVDCESLLPGYDFADAYQIAITPNVDAIEATRRAFARAPRWAASLMALRDELVRPFGLKPAPATRFPVVSETPEQVVIGFDDRHLDFRVVVNVADGKATLTTLVRRHNWLGRTYLFAILPFHRLIAPAFAARIG
jgi:hypothetical protein